MNYSHIYEKTYELLMASSEIDTVLLERICMYKNVNCDWIYNPCSYIDSHHSPGSGVHVFQLPQIS